MRIVQVVTDTDRRGAQLFAVDLGGALAQRGHSVDTVALSRGRGGDRGLPIPVLGTRRRGLSTLARLHRRVRDADVVIGHGSATASACAIGAGRTPFVYRQVSDPRFWAPTNVRRWRVRTYLRRARAVVALSTISRDALVEHIGVAVPKIRVITNGVSSLLFPPVDDERRRGARARLGLLNRPTVLVIGALVPEKGVDVAIEAIARCDDVQLVVTGDGPQRDELEALGHLIAAGRVRFLGAVEDRADTFALADVVVMPSRGGDSIPAALIEAGMSALPAIATGVGAVEDVVIDGETGIIVARDDAASLADAIDGLVTDTRRAHALGARAREHCLEHFELEGVAREWDELLGDVVSAGR